MSRLYAVVIGAVIVLFLSACDPFKADQIDAQARADALAVQTAQEAQNQEQARRHAEDQHMIEMQEATRIQQRKDALEVYIRDGLYYMLVTSMLVGTAVIAYTIFTVGRQTAVQINRVQEGLATALITSADLRSRLIRLDPVTRQYPLLYQYNGHGRYLVTDPNTKVTMELDTRNEGDAQMISGAITIRHSGVLAMEQRKSGARDAASVALIKPPIIEGTAMDVKTIARDLVGKGGWDDE